MSRLTYNKVLIFLVTAIQVHIISIPVLKTARQLHPDTNFSQSSFLDYCFISIQVLIHLNMGAKFLVPPSSNNSTPSRSWIQHLSYIRVPFQIHTCLRMCISNQSNPTSPVFRSQDSCLTSIHVQFQLLSGNYFSIISNHHTSHLLSGLDFWASPASGSVFT